MSIEWKETELGKIAFTTSGGTPSRKNENYYSGGTIPWVKSGELEFGTITKTEEFITQAGIDNSSSKIFPKGTLLIALYGATIGKLSFLGIDAATNQAVCGIFENDTVDLKYLYYFLLFQRPNLVRQGIGGAQPNISQTILKKLMVPYPKEKSEQERIVAKIEELFSELDNGVETLKKIKQQLAVYRQAVLKEAFEGKFTAHIPCDVELSWASEEETKSLPAIPKEWQYIALSNLGDLGRGKSKHRPRNDPKLFEGGKYPFLQTGEVKAAKQYITEYSKMYGEFGLQQSKLWPKGTLCITIAANIAETAFLGIDACFPDSVVGFTPYAHIIPEYIKYFIESQKLRLWAFAPATAQKNINLDTLENLIVPYCSVEEQQLVIAEIEARMTICDSIEQTVGIALQQAEAMRQSILKKAFEGEL